MAPAQLSVVFFLELFAILVVSRGVGWLATRFLGQPQVVGEMIAGVLLGFLEGDFARQAGLQSEAERRSAVLGVFARLFGDRARRLERYIEKSWAEE